MIEVVIFIISLLIFVLLIVLKLEASLSATQFVIDHKEVRIKSIIDKLTLTDRQIEIIDFIELHNQIESSDLENLFSGISKRTIRRDLSKLIHLGLVEKTGITKGVKYSIKFSK